MKEKMIVYELPFIIIYFKQIGFQRNATVMGKNVNVLIISIGTVDDLSSWKSRRKRRHIDKVQFFSLVDLDMDTCS